jgi:hypothetical protein
MPWSGSGQFLRTFSWRADKAAGLDISSSRMDIDSDDLAANGLGNALTRDGQGSASANLPMNNFRHTGVQDGLNRTDYSSLKQAQDGLIGWTIAGGTADAITATYTPGRGAPSDGSLRAFRATAANATTTPTFAPDSQTARTITKVGGAVLGVGDIPGNLAEVWVRYNSGNTRYELLNPANTVFHPTTGDGKITLKTTADAGWILCDDGTFGSATSGSSNRAIADTRSLFTLFFNNLTDAVAPILTSSGGATTRAGQGSAAAGWAANCRMTLTKQLGRSIAIAGAGSGLTSRALGSTVGNETSTLAQRTCRPTRRAARSPTALSTAAVLSLARLPWARAMTAEQVCPTARLPASLRAPQHLQATPKAARQRPCRICSQPPSGM